MVWATRHLNWDVITRMTSNATMRHLMLLRLMPDYGV